MRRSARPSFLVTFGLLSLALVGLIGVVLGQVMSDRLRHFALSQAEQSARVATNVSVAPLFTPADLSRDFVPLDPPRVAEIDRALGSAVSANGIVRMKVWNRQHWVVYSDNQNLRGKWFPSSAQLTGALQGATSREITDLTQPEEQEERNFGRLMAVYVPLHAAPGADRFTDDATQPVLGAFEIYVPYAPIAASIRGDEHRLYLALALALTALYLGQFRLVAGASRRLRRQSELNAHQATHDPLTGLPNRVLFRDRLDRAIAAAARRGELVGVILLDLDRFKEINDTLGHHRGDEVLVQIGERLAHRLRAADSVARLGGDEFVLIVPDITDSDAALALGAELDALLQQPFAVGGFDLDVRASIGIALYPEHGADPDVLLQRADVAMYVAKAAHSGCELYRPEHDQYSAERLELAADVRRGLDAGEFVAYYQPKLDLRTGEVIGAESLVRWQHPERGLLTPAAFIDVVENTELIGPLTMAMMDIVLVDRAMFVASGLGLSLALNVSARTVNRRDLAEIIDSQLTLHGVPASRFEIELTESAVLDNPVRARQVLAEVAALGVKIAIDDFGTGYASLAYLTDLPVHSLKIDQRFVKQLLDGRQDAAIVTFSIDLGRSLGLTVVAEGVEDAATLQRLADLGCSVAQGYHLAKPMSAASLVDWIARFDAAEFGLALDAEVGA